MSMSSMARFTIVSRIESDGKSYNLALSGEQEKRRNFPKGTIFLMTTDGNFLHIGEISSYFLVIIQGRINHDKDFGPYAEGLKLFWCLLKDVVGSFGNI